MGAATDQAAATSDASLQTPVDILVYGYGDGSGYIGTGHVDLLESRGYTVDVSDGPVAAERMASASVVVGLGLNVQDAEAREALAEYVYGGGRLLLMVNTEYAKCGVTEPCRYDFTKEVFGFGFGFDGDVQYSTICPAKGGEAHPIWNHPNVLSEFDDWCCDAYVGDITDTQNVKVIATVSGESYKHGVFSTMRDVPAIVVNDNPAWGGGMAVGAGMHMVSGWHGPDMRMFDNIIGFMMSGVPEQQAYEETGETVSAVLAVKPGQSTTFQDVNNLEFSCSGATAVRSITFDDLASSFVSFMALKIGVGSDTTDHQDLTLKHVGHHVYAATLDDPLEFGGGILTLSGTIVGGDSILVTVRYDTVRDGACEVVPRSDTHDSPAPPQDPPDQDDAIVGEPVPVSAIFDNRDGFTALDRPTFVELFGRDGRTYAIVTADNDRGVQIMDVTDPYVPTPVSAIFDNRDGFTALDAATIIDVFERDGRTYAIVASRNDHGIQIMDVTDPYVPTPVSAIFDNRDGFTALGGAHGVEVFLSGSRTYAIVAAHADNGIQIIDVHDPVNPSPVSAIFDNRDGFGALSEARIVEVFWSGDRTYAIVAAALDGVQILDITDPYTPSPVSAIFDNRDGFTALDGAHDVEVFWSGDRTYAIVTGAYEKGVQILDITDPYTRWWDSRF